MTADPWSRFLADADPRTLVDCLQNALRAALSHHASVTAADGTRVCPACSRAAGEAVKVPCGEVADILSALTGDKPTTNERTSDG